APLILTDGVTYRDPTNPNAGIWGEPVDGTVNISVFDGQGAGPLAGALAILGADPETSLKCITDDRGQCVISERGLVGPLQLTVHKYQYSAYTIAGFTGRDATVFIREQDPPAQTGPPGAGGGAQPPPVPINSIVGTISGEVIGLGKYVLPPAPDCTVLGTPDGEQCTECSEGTTCPGELSCTPIADTGSWCFQTCDSDDECNNGYVCSPTGYGSRCLPFTGTVSAQCRTSRRSFFGSNPEPGLGADVTADNPFFTIDSRPGEVTVYCVAGYTNPQNGQFIATRMGIQPTVLVYIDEETTGITVELDIPLSRTLRMRVFDLPEHEAGIGLPSFRNALDLGAEGWIEFPSIPSTTIGEIRLFPGYPESLTPFGPDAALTFYSWVNPNASGNIPSSYFMAHKVKSIDGDPLSLRSDDGAWASEVSGMRGDLHDVWSAAADDVWAVGPNGRLVHLGPLGWGIQPQFTDVDLHGIWGASANQIWAVGDYGTILSFDGVTWASDIDADTVDWHIRDVHGQWAVGDGGIIRRSNGQWVTQPVIHSSGLTAVFSHEDSAVAVGLAGKVLTYEDGAWSADLPVTTGEMLRAVWADGGGTYVVGDDGIVLFRAPNGEWAVTRISDRNLHAVVGNQDSIWVAGTVGAVWRLDRYSGQWFDETSADLGRVDLKSLSLSAGGLRSAGTTSIPFGPWMAFVEAVNPAPYQVYSPGNVAWDYRHDNPVPSYNTLFLTSNDGKNLWTILSAGPISSVYLPPLDDLTGWDPLMAGTKYMSLTRSLTPGFSMGGYRFNKLSMWRRTTWSSLYGNFY
ncbi:MAG: hypothetical protein VX223_06075, partial [Myxococcota bacterium]|nr:hypothetical protein [Myxococcota bacterium]